jgi:GH43 family beta-xylosidase
MTEDLTAFFTKTYLNPVYSRSFPDPYILKYRGEYFAYCTGFWHDGKVFGVLHSRDLVNWTEIGGAMNPLETGAPFYWAPEVTYDNGKFYLYYSVGNEALMEIRVAVSDRPGGGFEDCGKRLTTEDFAIDAHVFTDTDGECYLFYATDFLEHSHIGTGTVIDKMIDLQTLAGNARPVTRAKYDWQVYDPNRKEKGSVRWHTVEGAFVLKRKNIYYEMFSGGNWQNVSYGVSFAVTDDIKKNEEWMQFSDGEKVLPILRTLPDLVVGPGHNSVIRGTNNRELFCVYHRWDENGRVLAIDRMDFAGTRIFINGATYTPQTTPFKPTFIDFFDGENLSEKWQAVGEWKISENQAINGISEKDELLCKQTTESFLCEVSLRAVEAIDENSSFGFYLRGESEKTFEFLIFPNLKQAVVYWLEDGKARKHIFEFSDDFIPQAFHLLRVEVDEFYIKFSLDENIIRFEKLLEKSSTQIALIAEKLCAAFSGFALTEGFEDLFDRQDSEIEMREWENITGEGFYRIENQQLIFSNKSETDAILIKGAVHAQYEFVANVRLVEAFGEKFDFGFLLFNQKSEIVSRFTIKENKQNFYLIDDKYSQYSLPKSFAPKNYHQFRFLRLGEKLIFELEENILGEIFVPEGETKIGLFSKNSTLALDMVRLTVL